MQLLRLLISERIGRRTGVGEQVEFHPVANAFPLIEGEKFDEFAESIRVNGLRNPIWRHKDGRIIDGRNRYLACLKVGVEPRMKTFEGSDEELVPFVLTQNMDRRHLTDSQRAMAASELAKLEQGARTDLQPSADLRKVSQPKAAEILDVSVRNVQKARRVTEAGVPELVEAVKKGKLSINRADEIVGTGLGESVRSGSMSVEEASVKARKIIKNRKEEKSKKKEDEKKKPEKSPVAKATKTAKANLKLVHDADMDAVFHVLYLLNNLADRSKQIEPAVLHSKIPEDRIHNLDISLSRARDFVDGLFQVWMAKKNASANSGEAAAAS
jgi:ParB-like chromosome segregation protein Spo0J